jgi:hypothetical protein
LELWDTLSDLSVDGAVITSDAPGGLYDQIASWINSRLPRNKKGCLAIIAGACLAHSALRQKLGNSPLGNLIGGLVGSTVRQLAVRARKDGDANQPIDVLTRPEPPKPRGRDALLAVSMDIRMKLLLQSKKLATEEERTLFKESIRHCDAEQLTAIAETPIEDLAALLSLLTKESVVVSTARHATEAVNGLTRFIAPWMGKRKE